MLHIQRWLQILWLAAALLLVYSNYVHSGPDQFGIAFLLWSAVAAGTVLLFVPPLKAGLLVSAVSASAVVLVVGCWATLELLQGLPHGPRHEGNPVTIFIALLYFGIAVIPGLLALLLCRLNRRILSLPHSSASSRRIGA